MPEDPFKVKILSVNICGILEKIETLGREKAEPVARVDEGDVGSEGEGAFVGDWGLVGEEVLFLTAVDD